MTIDDVDDVRARLDLWLASEERAIRDSRAQALVERDTARREVERLTRVVEDLHIQDEAATAAHRAEVERLTRERDAAHERGRVEALAAAPRCTNCGGCLSRRGVALHDALADRDRLASSLADEKLESSAWRAKARDKGDCARDLRAERDALAAALAEVREAVELYSGECTERMTYAVASWAAADEHSRTCETCIAARRMAAALAATPADLATARDARVRAAALREAAALTGEAIKGSIGWVGITDGQERHTSEWLLAMAERIERGER